MNPLLGGVVAQITREVHTGHQEVPTILWYTEHSPATLDLIDGILLAVDYLIIDLDRIGQDAWTDEQHARHQTWADNLTFFRGSQATARAIPLCLLQVVHLGAVTAMRATMEEKEAMEGIED